MGYCKEQMKENIEKTLLEYVAVKSDTNSKLERDVEAFFEKWFEKVPYFKENKDKRGIFTIPDDYLNRSVPWCLLKGKGNDTVIYIHHYDCVETKDFGVLEHLSLKPYELMEAFRDGKMEIPPHVRADLDSGDWMFGRGVNDMKGGGSVELSLVEHYSQNPDFKGNVIILAVPDEENLSAGMRGAILLLKQLKDKYGLKYVMMLDAEAHERDEDGKFAVYDGSVGKIMPVFYARGKLAHVGQVFNGLNPINLLSEVVRRTELNTHLMDKAGNTVSLPPTWLYHKDRKTVYDVSLPIATCGYMSILPVKQSPKEIMDFLKDVSVKAMDTVIDDMNEKYKTYLEARNETVQKLPWNTNVKFYSELYNDAVRDSGEAFLKAYAETMAEVREKFNANERTTIESANVIIEMTLNYVKDLSPLIVIAICPPYYPHVNGSMLGEAGARVVSAMEDMMAFLKSEFDQDSKVKNYYTGISDLSYAMFAMDKENIDYIEQNMLMWKDVYYIPLDIIKEISMPVLNVGPWGKDIHKYTERALTHDLFYKVPAMIDNITNTLLGN